MKKMTYKITEFVEEIHNLVSEIPVDEIVVEDVEGELIHVDKVYYNAMTGFIHIKLGKMLDDDDD
jgi:hypothetical protein